MIKNYSMLGICFGTPIKGISNKRRFACVLNRWARSFAQGSVISLIFGVALTGHAFATTGSGSVSASVSSSASVETGTSLTIGTEDSSSNLFFAAVAPTGGTEVTVEPAAADSGADALSDQLANFQTAAGYTDIPATVAISGEPFQVFAVSLPAQTTFIDGGTIVNVNNYMHDAGGTPAMDGSGSSVVNIGATANVTQTGESPDFLEATEIPAAPASGPEAGEVLVAEPGEAGEAVASEAGAGPEASPSQQLDVTGLLEGFSTGSPYLEITISYN